MKLSDIDEILSVFRGMSNVEFDQAMEQGYLESDNRYSPYEHQTGGVTCFGNYKTAVHYAKDVAITKPADIYIDYRSERPREKSYVGIVVEIPRTLVKDRAQDRRVHSDEYWSFEPIPVDKIIRVWSFTPYVVDDIVYFKEELIDL